MNLSDIDQITKEYAAEREKLSERIRTLEDEINALKRKRLPIIKTTVQHVMAKQEILKAAIEESKDQFVKPRTVVFHGIQVGLQKSKGKISWADDDQVIKLIKKHLPEQADVLIKTIEKPIKDALKNLPAADLKRIGVTVNETGDQVVIKSTDSEIDKFVETLLKDDTIASVEEAA